MTTNKIELENFVFENDQISDINMTEELSIIGSDLPYNTMEFTVHHEDNEISIIRPIIDGSDPSDPIYADGILTADGDILVPFFGGNIMFLEYGSELKYYINGEIHRKLYVSDVARVGPQDFRIKCMSFVGILSEQFHNGGMYFGTYASDIVSDIFNDSGITNVGIAYEIGRVKVYGWLPRASKRENLQQLLFAINGHITYGLTGDDPIIDYITDANRASISRPMTYDTGEIRQPTRATKCIVTEHTYFYNAAVDFVTVFDNSSSSYMSQYQWISFSNAPINESTIVTEGNISVTEANANGAYVRGNGKIYAKPYSHTTFDIVADRDSSFPVHEVTIKDATLVSIANSVNIAERLMEYYSQSYIDKISIIYDRQRCGKVYNFTDSFGDTVTGILTNMKKNVSAIVKADCEFTTMFTPGANSNNYSQYTLLTGIGTWIVPSGVSHIRAVLIGGGSGGSSGTAGEPGNNNTGGRGGTGGSPGKGGKIYIMDFDVSPGESILYSCGYGGYGGVQTASTTEHNLGGAGGDTIFNEQSSANGEYSETGIKNIFVKSSAVYACDGHAGVDGGDGGSSDSANTENGGSVSYEYIEPDGTEHVLNQTGGISGKSLMNNRVGASSFSITGGSGGGACANKNGYNGTDAYYTTEKKSVPGSVSAIISTNGSGGNGASPDQAANATHYGCGGNGGHGGGGGGGAGQTTSNNIFYYTEQDPDFETFFYGEELTEKYGTPGIGGLGGSGGFGQNGCVIVYY